MLYYRGCLVNCLAALILFLYLTLAFPRFVGGAPLSSSARLLFFGLTIVFGVAPFAWLARSFWLMVKTKPDHCLGCGLTLSFASDRCAHCGKMLTKRQPGR
jgi:hypothetical protein